MSAEEGTISNECNIENKHNITNYLFRKFNYKSEMYLIKITYHKITVSIVANLNFEKKKRLPK